MVEADKIVNIENLGEDWLNSAFSSFESLKKTITYLNEANSFDLYNNEEDLSLDQINNKQAIKETMVLLPLTYIMEKFLKAVILHYDVNGDHDRLTAVRDILNNVKMSSNVKGNFHNILLLTDYIATHIDSHFMNLFANVYVARREGYNGESERSNPLSHTWTPFDRIDFATDKYQNAFIDFRYLYEKKDRVDSVDLVKLMDYVSSIRDVAFYLVSRKKALDFFSQFKEFEKVCPNPDETFARNRELVDSDGIDLLYSIENNIAMYAPIVSRERDLPEESKEEQEYWEKKRSLCKEIKQIASKFKKEYKPEFTRKKNNQTENQDSY